MSGNYPAGVTGNEPQIIGDGLEDKCCHCVDEAENDHIKDNLNDWVIEVQGEYICEDHLAKFLDDQGVKLADIKQLGKEELVREIREFLKEEVEK